jgi:myo-inositol-1(or 4)-monophosphatase
MPERPQFVPAMAEIAREAGALLMGYFHRRVKVEYKGDVDLVTEADRASEALITRRIRERWPEHNIMGEEGTRTEQGSEYRWYVDPLDGTTNFAHGYPFFCTSVALAVDGTVVAGAVYDPLKDELFTAERGAGAHLNGRRLGVTRTTDLLRALLVTGFPYDLRDDLAAKLRLFNRFMGEARAIRRDGAAALDLAYVAAGRVDGFWEERLQPWDMMAGILFVEEAGGRATRFDGTAVGLRADELVAAGPGLHPLMLEVLGRS